MGLNPNQPALPAFREFDGLYNVVPPDRVPDTGLTEAVNVDINDAKQVSRRQGYTRAQTGSFHSVWGYRDGAYVVRNGDLFWYAPVDNTLKRLVEGVGSAPLCYVDAGDRVLVSNGTDSWCLRGTDWFMMGVPNPPKPSLSATTGGSLPAGTYTVCLALARLDGLEGGPSEFTQIEVQKNGLLTVTWDGSILAYLEYKRLNVYISSPSGEALYLHSSLDPTTGSLVIGEVAQGRILATQGLYALPAFTSAAFYNGRVYAAQGTVLWYSDIYNVELSRLYGNYIQFDSPITMVGDVTDGLYVSDSDTVYFLSGQDAPLSMRPILDYPALSGSFVPVDSGRAGMTSEAVMFATDEGVVFAQPGGSAKNLTQEKFLYTTGKSAAAMFRQYNGYGQYILTIKE